MPVSLVTPSTSWRDVVAEALAHVVQRRARVLDRVVQQRRADRVGVEAHARADLRDADRVGDELLARLAPLVGVALAGEARTPRRPGRGRPARIASSACSEIDARTGPRAAPARASAGPSELRVRGRRRRSLRRSRRRARARRAASLAPPPASGVTPLAGPWASPLPLACDAVVRCARLWCQLVQKSEAPLRRSAE